MPAGFTDQQPGGTRATTIKFSFNSVTENLNCKQLFAVTNIKMV
ncbi:hypothetical protein [Flyfo siphovirus Tbat1_6]|nr:hypothetical protein PRB80_gp88 [Flyfo siphovirus Tbat1_6]UIW10288.1 hypothetical protein [Flyfo siphovirus Tbat1_6]